MNAHPVAVCQLAVGEGGVDNYPVLAVWLRSRAHLLRPPRVERHLVEYLVPASPRPPGDVGLHLRESARQREHVPRKHHLHLEVVSVEVHPELERAEELPVGVVARELDGERQVEVSGRRR